MITSADFSPCGLYRYSLIRIWDRTKPLVNWCALNPSIADQYKNDPTIVREMGFTKAWGFGGLIKTNIFAYKSTDPKRLYSFHDPVGPDNDAYLQAAAIKCDLRIAAWGIHGALLGRGSWVCCKILQDFPMHCLGITKDGYPKHPLYLSADTKLIPYYWGTRNSQN